MGGRNKGEDDHLSLTKDMRSHTTHKQTSNTAHYHAQTNVCAYVRRNMYNKIKSTFELSKHQRYLEFFFWEVFIIKMGGCSSRQESGEGVAYRDDLARAKLTPVNRDAK